MPFALRLGVIFACANAISYGQILPLYAPFRCTSQAAPPAIVRAEGISERVGDIMVVCYFGYPAAIGAPIPPVNIRIFFNTNLGSRLLTQANAGSFSEAMLIVDEPNSPANPQTPLRLCGDRNTNELPSNPGVCALFGSANSAQTYSGANPDPMTSPNNRPNVFQGRQVAANAVEFPGVPLNPPGSQITPVLPVRTFRFTNLRVNPATLGDTNSFVPKQILAYVSMSNIPVSGFLPTQTIAFVQPALQASVEDRTKLLRCESRNPMQKAFSVRMTESFPSSFKPLNSAQSDPDATTYPEVFANQNIPGASYATEDGFINTTAALGRTYADPRSQAFPDVRGIRNAGAADSGTRLSIRLYEVPAGVRIFVPGVLPLRSKLTGLPTGRAVLTADTGPFSPRLTDENGLVQIDTGIATYEVLGAEPFDTERLDVPVSVAYEAGSPETGIQTSITAGLSTRDEARAPRYDAFFIEPCNCSLLFPTVSNRNGYDTGIAISNAGLDQGVVQLHYFCGTAECTSPPRQTTAEPVESGNQLTFTLSGGGSAGIEPVPGFQGYIIAQAQFRYCHGFAMLSAVNAVANNNGAFRAYLALPLDRPTHRPDVSLSEGLRH